MPVRLLAMMVVCAALLPALPAQAGPEGRPPPIVFNTAPLAFGMSLDVAARALGVPLSHVEGRPGDELMLAMRAVGGSGLWPRADRLYLQFRHGRLTGWKGDWGAPWLWR